MAPPRARRPARRRSLGACARACAFLWLEPSAHPARARFAPLVLAAADAGGCRAAPASPPRWRFVLASVAYGAVRGGHLPVIMAELRDFRDAAANARRLPHHLDRARRPAPADPRGHSRHRRHHRPDLAAVPRRRRGAGAAQGQSLDRRSHGAQALSGPPADRGHRARRLRALAAGRQGRGHRRRRHRGRALCRAAVSPSCRWWSASAPKPGPRISWRCSTNIPRSATSCAPRSWSPSGAGTSCSRTASTCACRKPTSSRRSTRWSSSTATRRS